MIPDVQMGVSMFCTQICILNIKYIKYKIKVKINVKIQFAWKESAIGTKTVEAVVQPLSFT